MSSQKSKTFQMSARCPLCETNFDPFSARVIESREDYHLLHSQCENCGSYIVSLAASTPFGLSSIGIITDLTASDILKFKDQNRITTDDVIEFHQTVAQKQSLIHDS